MSWHDDFKTTHLSGESLTLADKVRGYLHETLLDLNELSSGCGLFADEFSFITGGGDRDYTTHEVDAVLHLVMDGGVLYDMYSPNGDGEYMFGGGSRYKLEQFIEDLGYLPEWTTSYCLSIRRGDC